MPVEGFYERFRHLVREFRDAIGSAGVVEEPREYRFEVVFPDRRYALQAFPDENRVFVGEEVGDYGVVWFDELRYDELHHGWRASDRSAWDLAQSIIDRKPMVPAAVPAPSATAPGIAERPHPVARAIALVVLVMRGVRWLTRIRRGSVAGQVVTQVWRRYRARWPTTSTR